MIYFIHSHAYQILQKTSDSTLSQMDRSQITYSLEKQRLARLKAMNALLGQPDLISIYKVTTVSSFLSHKKVYERQEMFVFGLNFPTTAHFSSYINDRFHVTKKQNKMETEYKIKLFTYDIFKKLDFVIEVNVPGSIAVRAYGLNGQPLNTANIQYQSVYISSILRSLYPHYYHPNTQMHGQIQKYEILQNFIKTFVPFALNNQLQIPEDMLYVHNLGIELLANYLKSHCFWNLCDILYQQLIVLLPEKALFFLLEVKELRGQFKQVVLHCATQLLRENNDNQKMVRLIQFQVRSLSKLGKKMEVKSLGENIIKQGLDNLQTWQETLKVYFEEGDDRKYFKMLNTAINFSGEDITLKQKIQKIINPRKLLHSTKQIENQNREKNKNISYYPQYMLKFDYNFMQQDTKLRNLQQLLQKSQKQKPTSQLMSRMQISMQKQTFFQKFVALYEKNRGWSKLIQLRNQCFWLENDYVTYQNSLKKKGSDLSYRYMNQSLSDIEVKHDKGTEKSIDKSLNKTKEKTVTSEKYQVYEQQERKHPNMDQSFDGEFSESQSQNDGEINVVAPCSKRVATKRVSREQLATKKVEFVKIICNYNLEKMFLTAYNNLKLHGDLEKWSSKLNMTDMANLTKQKKDLIAYIMLKKGYIHKNMLRYRKSEEAFKNARKCSNQPMICLISSYSLAKLYLDHNNIKGVEYYTVQIVRILFSLGIQEFNAVPEWAKQIIPFIIRHHGKAIIKRLQGPLKQIVQLWLSIDYKSIIKN